MAKKKWIQDIDMKKGALRKSLKIKKGKDISAAKLRKAAAGKGVSKKTQKRAVLAETLKGFKKK